jgi:hypothetical protein
MQNKGIHASLVEAMQAARDRAKVLGQELGA